MEAEVGTLFATDVSSALPTFDQIVQRYKGEVSNVDIKPNYRQDAELVIEPVSGGLNVTVRDTNHKTLLSFIVGRGEASDMTAQVALLKGLRELIKSRLPKVATATREVGKDVAIEALDAFERDVIKRLRDSVNTIKETPATRVRAGAIIDSLLDARKIIDDRMTASRASMSDAGEKK